MINNFTNNVDKIKTFTYNICFLIKIKRTLKILIAMYR